MRFAIAIALLLGGCIKPAAAFLCSSDDQCAHAGVGGTCEISGVCAFPDTACSSGKRYGALSGVHSDQCVGGDDLADAGPHVDARTDGPPIDAHPDAPPDAPACPSSYAPLANAGPHVYRLVTTPAAWANQRSICRADSPAAQLAVPDNAAELLAIATLAGTDTWVGLSDASLEGTFVTSYNVNATFLPWAPGEPDNNGNQDCVRALAAGATIQTDLCATLSVAVCECVP